MANEQDSSKISSVKKEISDDLANLRFKLLANMPFIGNVAMRFDLVPVRDVRCRTACTDGSSIYFDCEFYAGLTEQERLFTFAHEVWHNVMLHFARLQGRDRSLFNIATDMEVNSLLVGCPSGTGTKNAYKFTPPKGLCFPPYDMKGKSAEELYEWLLKQDKKKNGGSAAGLSGQFDKHVYTGHEQDESEATAKAVKDRWGDVGFDKDFRPRVSSDAKERVREAVTSAVQRYNREHGELPADIAGAVDKILHPEIKWQDVLAQFVTSCYGGRRSWLPPNRRHVYNDMYFQSRRNQTINGVVAVDTSGSCVEDLPKFFGELKGLVDSFGSYQIKVIQADAAVTKVDDYDYYSPFSADCGVEWSGGGGTSYDPVFRYISENGIRPDFLIYIGDGYADISVKKPDYPVMWLITKNGSTNFVEWGRKIRFKN